MNVSRELRSTVITRLDPLTEYSVRVASVNSDGIGPYSEPVSMNTSKLSSHTHFMLFNSCCNYLSWVQFHG